MKKVNWAQAWKEAKVQSRKNGNTRNEALWTSYWDYVADTYLVDSVSNETYYRRIIEFLMMESCFSKGDKVLDIGCGPGTYALLFAKDAHLVDALDSSRGMLSVLMEEAARRGLSNIRKIHSGWEEYQPQERYELVFSAMSPAVYDEKTLLKMEAYASRGCCLITYGQGFESPVIKALWERLIGQYRSSNAYLYVYPQGVLQQKGRHPATRIFSLDQRRRTPVKEIVNRYTRYFNIFTAMDKQKTRVIEAYFDEHSQNGFFEDAVQLKLAAICWKVPENG